MTRTLLGEGPDPGRSLLVLRAVTHGRAQGVTTIKTIKAELAINDLTRTRHTSHVTLLP